MAQFDENCGAIVARFIKLRHLCGAVDRLLFEIKLPGMANPLYRDRVNQHLRIGMRAVALLKAERISQLHSRKLRSFSEVAFQ